MMFIKFRQKLIAWLRESDDYDDRGRYMPADAYNHEPIPEYKTSSISSANIKKHRARNAAIKVAEPSNEDNLESNFKSRGIFFKLIPGAGGLVLEARQFDDRQGEWATVVHVIPEADDLATSLSHIITMQSLRA